MKSTMCLSTKAQSLPSAELDRLAKIDSLPYDVSIYVTIHAVDSGKHRLPFILARYPISKQSQYTLRFPSGQIYIKADSTSTVEKDVAARCLTDLGLPVKADHLNQKKEDEVHQPAV